MKFVIYIMVLSWGFYSNATVVCTDAFETESRERGSGVTSALNWYRAQIDKINQIGFYEAFESGLRDKKKAYQTRLRILAKFTEDQLSSMTGDQIHFFSFNELRSLRTLTPDNIALLNKEIPFSRQKALTLKQVEIFSAVTLPEIRRQLPYQTSNHRLIEAWDYLSAIAEYGRNGWSIFRSYIYESAIAKDEIMRTFTGLQKDSMIVGQLDQLTAGQLKALQKLSPENIALLNKEVPLRRQIAMSRKEIANFSATTLATMDVNVTFTTSNHRLVEAWDYLKGLAANDRDAWPIFRHHTYKSNIAKNEIMWTFTGPQKDSMTAGQLAQLKPGQLKALQKLSPENIALLNKEVPLIRQITMSRKEIANFSATTLATMDLDRS